MSKINAIRLININYNYNGIRVDDETFHLNGESTLLSLRNGGGKSVLVQMLIAPFVHRRYRDSNKRKFAGYFTGNRPSFILVEWELDGNAGYVMTGMMVRKNQDTGDAKNQNDLDIYQFIHEYQEQNRYDIHKIPFIKTGEDNKTLLKFSECKGLLEDLKASNDYKFTLYDMNNGVQSKNYFNKLKEYQIYHKEWESIVRKINIKESGLSELFTNAKDEAGLIETWFLPAVEDKLNKDKNRIEEFRDILGKYIKQYKDNKSKIDQKKTILLFKEETVSVLDIAESLKSSFEEKSIFENTIANLIKKLRGLKDRLDSERIVLAENEVALATEIDRISHEEISFEIYGLEGEKKELAKGILELNRLIEKSEEEKVSLVKGKNIQECAKINRHYKEASRDVQIWENKRDLIKKDEAENAPEREALGYTLRHYYESEEERIKGLLEGVNTKINELDHTNEGLEKELEGLRDLEIKENRKLSATDEKILAYDKLEKNFNEIYKEDLRRNILKKYEEGNLEIRIERLKESIEETGLAIIRLKKTRLENDQQLKGQKRRIQEKSNELAMLTQEIKNLEEKLEKINQEIETRKSIIRHIGFGEERVFDKEEILKEFKRKMDEVSETIKPIEQRLVDLEKEYDKLKSGKVLELPSNIEEALENRGINYVYGMEWLKRNNKSLKENTKIVKNNPFIPYGLILTSNEVEKLKTADLGIYTSFPLPIIIREKLEEDFAGIESSIHQGEKVNFYILFNNNLLDEEELAMILSDKKDGIERAEESLDKRLNDYGEYEKKYNKIYYQDLTEKEYQDIKSRLTSGKETKKSLEDEINEIKENERTLENSIEELLGNINKREKELDELYRKDRALEELCNEYKEFLILLKDRTDTNDNILKTGESIQAIKAQIKRINQSREDALDLRSDYREMGRFTAERLQVYLGYDKRDLIDKDIEDIEARFIALSSVIAAELKEVEEALANAYSKFQIQEKDLIGTSMRLNVSEEEYKDEVYDSFILDSMERDLARCDAKIKGLSNDLSDLRTRIAVKDEQISTKYKTLKERLNRDEPVAKNEIVLTEFKKRIAVKKEEVRKNKAILDLVNGRIRYCDNNLSALAEYYDLPIEKDIEFDVDISTMDGDSLNRFRGVMVRDYRQVGENINRLRNDLSVGIDKLLRNKHFQEDFYSKPLNTLYSLIGEAAEFIGQLTITIRAYDDLMAKLEVDIALVDKEKERITQILHEYISDVHKNLAKIDKNSTIKIREKYVKMLRIDLPDWEGEKSQYKNKLADIIEGLTQSGIMRLENNENIEEIISPIITTKNLYNAVVGIANIGIKLYKIEAERQHQINWGDVSINSGGEGFLSAFVILSSLLSFMRRDDTDIFAELEEGKVLIMDNPFAQTNAAHLLNPLMEIAKKNNTQLISFTGLSGESIYSSFDNIYVLNLVPSNLRKGMMYLQSRHTKGKDIEIMVASQIRSEDVEQTRLF